MTQTAQTVTKTGLAAVINNQATYNLWANTTLVNWLRTKPADLMDKEVPSSYSSLRATLLHIWDVERAWFGYITENPKVPFKVSGFDGSLEDVLEGLLKQSQEVVDYAASLSETELLGEVMCSITYVGNHSLKRVDILQQIFDHSILHRGQLLTIGHNLGISDAPMSDYMVHVLMIRSGN